MLFLVFGADPHANAANGASADFLKMLFHVFAASLGVKDFFPRSAHRPIAALYCMSRACLDADVTARARAFGKLIFAVKRAVGEKSAKPHKAAVFIVKKQRIAPD